MLRGLRRTRRPPVAYQPLAYWRLYGLRKPNQYVAAEYAWELGLEALQRNWCPARDRRWYMRPMAQVQRGRVYDKVRLAVTVRRAKLHPMGMALTDVDQQMAERLALQRAADA